MWVEIAEKKFVCQRTIRKLYVMVAYLNIYGVKTVITTVRILDYLVMNIKINRNPTEVVRWGYG